MLYVHIKLQAISEGQIGSCW